MGSPAGLSAAMLLGIVPLTACAKPAGVNDVVAGTVNY
jgi:hypothetical protein